MEFKLILQDIITEKGLTQTQLARLLNVKPSQVCEWLKGKSRPGYDYLRLMCEKLDISGDRVLGLKWN